MRNLSRPCARVPTRRFDVITNIPSYSGPALKRRLSIFVRLIDR